MKLITLLTDFGLQDGFVGVMKGVILNIAPQAAIVDLDHEVGPQNVLQGAFILGRCVPYFPPGTVHVAVVDPGVGTSRRPVAVHIMMQGKEFYCVGPDNGLFTYVYGLAEHQGGSFRVFQLNQPQYWLAEVSHVFHGRDIFSPVAAHLVNGVPVERLGTLVNDPLRLQLPPVEAIPGGARGRVAAIDVFGNLLTNLERERLAQFQNISLRVCGQVIHGLVRTFGSRPAGELIGLYDEENFLMVSVVNGNAQARLGARVGDAVEVMAEE